MSAKCFAGTTFTDLSFFQLDLHLHLTAVRPPLHLALEAVLVQLLGDYRNPAVAQVNPAPLVLALDAVMPAGGQQFAGNQQACAMEFVASVLTEVRVVHGYLVTYEQEGHCLTCNQVFRQVRTLK